MTDIRWRQRLDNYLTALARLQSAVQLSQTRALSDLEEQGLIQAFEFTHELAWKVMKDYLEYQDGGLRIAGSRDAASLAFSRGLVTDGEIWMEMIESRNNTVHTYESNILNNEYNRIVTLYYPAFEEFYLKMKSML